MPIFAPLGDLSGSLARRWCCVTEAGLWRPPRERRLMAVFLDRRRRTFSSGLDCGVVRCGWCRGHDSDVRRVLMRGSGLRGITAPLVMGVLVPGPEAR